MHMFIALVFVVRPANHFAAVHDLTLPLINASSHDFMYYMDPSIRFTTNITWNQVWGEMVAMEHPYYRRTSPNFCTRVDRPEVSTQMHIWGCDMFDAYDM